jgi:2-polyprenyl-3-methyl-5-hydroxy-6-metoxy-1,4-benzoquinol methylase
MESKNVCSICHATSVEIAYRFDSYNILRCKVCGTAYRETIHEETASQERYDEQKWLASRELFKDIYADEAKWRYGQLEIFQPGGRLLEIGFGTGEFLERASEAGHKVWGLDLSARAVAYINRSRPDINAQNCTLAEAGFPDDFFDVVVMLHVGTYGKSSSHTG